MQTGIKAAWLHENERSTLNAIIGLCWAFFQAIQSIITPYFMTGIGWQWAEIDQEFLPGMSHRSSGLAFRVGGGADFYLTRRIALTASGTYLIGLGDVGDFDTLQARLGWLFRF